MNKVVIFIMRGIIDVAFMVAAYFFVKFVLLNGEEPSFIVLYITLFVGAFIGEILFRAIRIIVREKKDEGERNKRA